MKVLIRRSAILQIHRTTWRSWRKTRSGSASERRIKPQRLLRLRSRRSIPPFFGDKRFASRPKFGEPTLEGEFALSIGGKNFVTSMVRSGWTLGSTEWQQFETEVEVPDKDSLDYGIVMVGPGEIEARRIQFQVL